MRSRSIPFVAAVGGLILTSVGAALGTNQLSHGRTALDQRLKEHASAAAVSLSERFDRNREVVRLLATNTVFQRALLEGSGGTHQLRVEAERALLSLEQLGDGLGEACLIAASGKELARVVLGLSAASPDLSPDESTAAFFRPALASPSGGSYQSPPYLSADTGEWVIANAAGIESPTGSRLGFVHFEVTVESLRKAAVASAGAGGASALSVVDAASGRIVVSLGKDRGAGVSLGRLDDRTFAAIDGLTDGQTTTVNDQRITFAVVEQAAGNANRWMVVGAAPAISFLAGIGFVSPALVLAGLISLALGAFGIIRSGRRDRRAREEAEHQARIDPMTGLFNRRHGVEAIAAELERSAEGRDGPAIVVLDIDHFKQVNDTYGHNAGDVVIKEVGRRIRASVRQGDVVVRWGGEEFCVLLPGEIGGPGAMAVAERIRKLVAFAPVLIGEKRSLTMTASVGAAVVEGEGWTVQSLVDAADRTLYAAKRRGRNLAVLFSELSEDDLVAEEPEAVRLARGLALVAGVRETSPDHHCEDVATMAARIADRLGLSESLVLRCKLGGWIHDVGKLAIPDRVVQKTTPLDEVERMTLQSHVTLGAEIVGRIASLRQASKAVLHHHERWDGTGYPDQLSEDAIPIEARIVACADAYSAITTGRPYQPALPPPDALAQLRRSAGLSLDPQVVEALAAVLEEDGHLKPEETPTIEGAVLA
jgi:diguanylate cyclase (GGDEF)-like protein/putative nucleotidyltransferase with HDIG domain